jgi:fumarate hydratase, class I
VPVPGDGALLVTGDLKMAEFSYRELVEVAHHDVPWRKLEGSYVEPARFGNAEILRVSPEAISDLSFNAFADIAHLLRPGHLKQLRAILDDKEA